VQILHVTRAVDWAAAQESGEYRWSTLGKTLDEVGFIHASTPEQVAATAARVHGPDATGLVVLVMDDDEIRAAGTPVIYEDGGNGQMYPHIYGPVRLTYVHEVRSVV
jgi:uncharacterized protein (DUF952 family)